MKMIPMPEVGDTFILKEIPMVGDNPGFPEESKVIEAGRGEPPLYNTEDGTWQLEYPDEDDYVCADVKWDEDKKVWREV